MLRTAGLGLVYGILCVCMFFTKGQFVLLFFCVHFAVFLCFLVFVLRLVISNSALALETHFPKCIEWAVLFPF